MMGDNIPKKTGKRGTRFLKETRGAVLAEFAIAFMPIMTIYLTMLELAHYFVIREVVVHAANATARAAAVVGDTNQPGGGKTNGAFPDDCKAAGEFVLRPWIKNGINIKNIKVNCTQDGSDPYGEDTGHVTADYTCSVPVAKLICCKNGARTIDVTSSFPHQGAKYKM